jgi:hypothetical protein
VRKALPPRRDLFGKRALRCVLGGRSYAEGSSVAVSGDIIVVGAPGANNGRGRAFIYERPSGGGGCLTTSDGGWSNFMRGDVVEVAPYSYTLYDNEMFGGGGVS